MKKGNTFISDSGVEHRHNFFDTLIIIGCAIVVVILGYLGVMAYIVG